MAKGKVTRKIKGLNKDGTISLPWRKFKSRLDFYADDQIDNWNEYNFLGHILKRYKDYMGIEFTLSYSGAPSKCSEMYCVKRMILALAAPNNQTVKDYIDFVFDTYVIPSKVTITSMAYFFTTNFIFDFKKKFRKDSVITRSTELPEKYKDIIDGLKVASGIDTYGDLAFVKLSIKEFPSSGDAKKYENMFDELKSVGFDDSILERMDGN